MKRESLTTAVVGVGNPHRYGVSLKYPNVVAPDWKHGEKRSRFTQGGSVNRFAGGFKTDYAT